jgi:hypothetical protein
VLITSVLDTVRGPKTVNETLLTIGTDHWQVILFHDGLTPGELQFMLVAPLARVNAAQRASSGAATSAEDHVAQLAKLAELHEAGALSDEEFAAAKTRILGASGTQADADDTAAQDG